MTRIVGGYQKNFFSSNLLTKLFVYAIIFYHKRKDAEQYANIFTFRELPIGARHSEIFAELTAERLP